MPLDAYDENDDGDAAADSKGAQGEEDADDGPVRLPNEDLLSYAVDTLLKVGTCVAITPPPPQPPTPHPHQYSHHHQVASCFAALRVGRG